MTREQAEEKQSMKEKLSERLPRTLSSPACMGLEGSSLLYHPTCASETRGPPGIGERKADVLPREKLTEESSQHRGGMARPPASGSEPGWHRL